MHRRRLPVSSLVFFALAATAAATSLLLMQSYARRLQAAHPDVGPTVPVVVAVGDLERGTTLTLDMVMADSLPERFSPPGAVAAVDDLPGRTLAADVEAGEVLTQVRLAGSSTGPVAALVPPEMRAFIVPTGLPQGTVRAGDTVDVLGAFGGGRPHVETVAAALQIARVLPPDPTSVSGAAGASGPRLVLLVDPSTAEQLAYASAFAQLMVTIAPPPTPASPSTSATPSP